MIENTGVTALLRVQRQLSVFQSVSMHEEGTLSLRNRRRYHQRFPMERTITPQQRSSSNKSTYHPFLFAMMTCSALAELGLTAFLVSAGHEHGTWPSKLYHAL